MKSKSLAPAILIGSSGQVADALKKSLSARGVQALCTSSRGGTGAHPLDLGDVASIRAFFRAADKELGAPAEVFLPGALTHVDRCENERDLCRRVNAEGPAVVAEECRARGHKLTYFSTEYVFGEAEYHGGAVGPFTEDDAPAPTSYYGACKLEAERSLQRILGPEGVLIVRTTMVFSWAPAGKNFFMQYHDHLSALAAGRPAAEFRIPEDQLSTPTYAPALAEATCRLREQGAGGIFNVVGSDFVSRRELVEKVIDAFGFDRSRSLAGFRFLKTAELGQRARRPLTAGLRVDKLQRFGVAPLSLAEAFADISRRKERGPV